MPGTTTHGDRREATVAQLTKEREGLVKAKKEIKQKFDAVDVYLADFAKVSILSKPWGIFVDGRQTTNAVASKVKDVAKVAATVSS